MSGRRTLVGGSIYTDANRANVRAVVFACTFTLTTTRTFAANIRTNNRLSINLT